MATTARRGWRLTAAWMVVMLVCGVAGEADAASDCRDTASVAYRLVHAVVNDTSLMASLAANQDTTLDLLRIMLANNNGWV